LRPRDSDFSQDWKPGTGEIPLLSLWFGAIEAQRFRLQPGLEAWDWGVSKHRANPGFCRNITITLILSCFSDGVDP
jgi:hypothetical protein